MPHNPESHAGTYGWIGLAAGVAVFDYLSPETLSHAVDRVLENPKTKYIAYAVGGLVAGHLFNILPERLDVIHQIGVSITDLEDTL